MTVEGVCIAFFWGSCGDRCVFDREIQDDMQYAIIDLLGFVDRVAVILYWQGIQTYCANPFLRGNTVINSSSMGFKLS